MDLEKLSDKTLLLLMEARRSEAETLFKAALDADELADSIAQEVARRGIVTGVIQNFNSAGQVIQGHPLSDESLHRLDGGKPMGKIIDIDIGANIAPEERERFRERLGAEITSIVSHLPSVGPRAPETPDPVMVVPDSNEPQCEGGTTHDWERIRNGPEVLLDACRLCPVRRWVEITEEGGTLSWNYGSPPPPKQRARMMQEDDELDEGEEWEDADGNVPREITGRQKKLTRVTDGRRVTVDP